MKGLFIIHCENFVYGAGRSVSMLLRSFPGEADVVLPIGLREARLPESEVRAALGDRIGRVYYTFLPWDMTCVPLADRRREAVKATVRQMLCCLSRPFLSRLCRTGGYDFIHLNSIVLHPMLTKRLPMLLHVREIVDDDLPAPARRRLKAHLDRAHGLVCIDESCRAALPDTTAPTCVLQNPFDMSAVLTADPSALRARFSIREEDTVYTIAGTITPEKGVLFALEAFREAALANAVFLIAGGRKSTAYYEEVAALAADVPNAHMIGEFADMSPVYAASDYVVRADLVPGPGRTVYESLYSGGSAILPGERTRDLPRLTIPPALEENVFYFATGERASLTDVFRATCGRRAGKRVNYENVSSYAQKFCAFAARCTGVKA